ncbi:MAG: hypothetical protein GWP45_13610, partial [Proteobacteria bacterium]|nr:hypothetical protein [Pseudomonadota bacterium]
WLNNDGPGPFDGPETLALAERCLLGFSAGPPSLPGLYNNYKRIVQTDDHVMILLEMVHDARVIRMNDSHGPADNRKWLGDAIGRWEGDTLVVETTNFREDTGLYGGDENLFLTEHFTPLENGNLLYDFTVQDDTAWTQPWSGAYVWKREQSRCTNTPAMKATTPWGIFCAVPDCWKVKLRLPEINHRVACDI